MRALIENKESVKELSHSRKQHVLDASVAMRSKISLTNELRIAIALFEIPVSGWTCLRTIKAIRVRVQVTAKMTQEKRTLVDVGRVSLLADLALLLLVTISWRSLLRGLLRSLVSGGLRWCLRGSGGRSLASSGSGFGGHCDEV